MFVEDSFKIFYPNKAFKSLPYVIDFKELLSII